MRIFNQACAVALLSFALPGVLTAADKEPAWTSAAIPDRPTFTMKASKAYVLVETHEWGMATTIMAKPSEADLAKERASYDAAFAKVHERWEKTSAQWEDDQKRGVAPSAKKPEEPTPETFPWQSFELRHAVWIGPLNRFAKKGVSLYLQEIEPGEYIYYGGIYLNANNGTDGICLCMGTVTFKAEADKITMLGRAHWPALEAVMALPKEVRFKTKIVLPEGVSSHQLTKATDLSRDPRLPAEKMVQAELKPLARHPNWYGVLVDRLTPIPGLFRYERDKQVDLTKPAPVAMVLAN